MPNQVMTASEVLELANHVRNMENLNNRCADTIAEKHGLPLGDAQILSRSLRSLPVQDQHPALFEIINRVIRSTESDPVLKKDFRTWLAQSANGQLHKLNIKLN